MVHEEGDQEEQGAPQVAPAVEPSGPPAESEIDADNDPIIVSGEVQQSGSFLSRLNPLRMFGKNKPDFYIKEGKDFLENQSYAQAMVAFNNALAIDPNNSAAYRGLGKVFFKKGGRSNLNTALKYYQEAIKRNPMEHDLYAISAKIYDAMKQPKEATLERKKFVIVRALEVDAKNPIANNNMGILFLQQGKADMALSYFQKAIDADKNYDVALRNLAAVHMKMAKESDDANQKIAHGQKAREAIVRSVEISPNPASLIAFARILLKEGDLEKVLVTCEQIDKMDPANKHVFQLKKMAFEGLGRFEEARNAQESYVVFSGGTMQEDGPPPED